LAAGVLLFLVLGHPPDGNSRLAIAQFFGHFHPLVVHFPIALLFLIPVFDFWAQRRRDQVLREASQFLLTLTMAAALAAPLLGWLLAYSGSFSGQLVTRHMWGGVTVGIATTLLWCLRRAGRAQTPAAALILLPLVAWTGYVGGQMSHGEDHLTKHLPPFLARWLPKSETAGPGNAVDSRTVFGGLVMPLLKARCVACHGNSKANGKLRLDSFEALMRGGASGAVVIAGNAVGSELIRRIKLPESDEKRMPAEGKPGFADEEVATLIRWIQNGASVTELMAAASVAGAAISMQIGDYRKDIPDLTALSQRLGVRLVPRTARAEDGLILRTAGSEAAMTDAVLAELAKSPAHRYIVEAELARTALTAQGLTSLRNWPHLRVVDLSHLTLTPDTYTIFKTLPELALLNLTGTTVSEAQVAQLRALKQQPRIYAFELRTP
jgi:uncharacterized membrane protein